MAVPTPLTTVFTPAPTCLSEIHWGTASPWFQLGADTRCIPSGANPSVSSFYSPGLYCPQGFTVACSTEVVDGSATETRATCCPQATALGSLSVSSFACQVNSLFFATSYGCVLGLGDLASNSLTVVATNTSTFLSTFSVGVFDAVNAWSVQIRWQASDLTSTSDTAQSTSSLQPAGSTSSSLAAETTLSSSLVKTIGGSVSTNPTTTTGSTVASATPTATSTSSGISSGAIIAIGVIIPVIVIAAAILAFFMIRRKKRAQPVVNSPHSNLSSELPVGAQEYKPVHEKEVLPSELDSTPRYEASSDTKSPIMKG